MYLLFLFGLLLVFAFAKALFEQYRPDDETKSQALSKQPEAQQTLKTENNKAPKQQQNSKQDQQAQAAPDLGFEQSESIGQRQGEIHFTETPDFLLPIPPIFEDLDFDNFEQKFGLKRHENQEQKENRYIGQFNDKGQKHGLGKFYYQDGSIYFGQWENNHRLGFGYYYWPNGDHYQGYWEQGKMQGLGQLDYGTGDCYQGSFVQEKRHGKGTYFYKDGDRYQGDWIEDRRTGYGIYYFASGERYEGYYAQSKLHGKGRRYFPNGKFRDEVWEHGQRKS